MEKHLNVHKRFLPTLQRHEPVILDSSAITTYKACARKFFYQYVLARVPSGQGPAYFQFGKAYHKFRELLSLFYIQHCKTKGNDIRNFPDSNLLSAIKGAMAEYDSGGGEPVLGTRFDFLTKARLFEACKVAYAHWVDEKKKGMIEVVSVEFPMNFSYSIEGKYRKCGRGDELILWNNGLWIRDFKCSAKNPEWYPKSLKIKDQAYTYIVGAAKLSDGRPVKGIIYEQMYNDKPLKKGDDGKKGPSIHSHIVQFTSSQLRNWEYEQSIIHEQIDRSRELDIYPMHENDMSCQWCDYYKVCDAMNENQMLGLLTNEYKVHIWDNMDPKDG